MLTFTCIRIVKLDIEILIGLPTMIVNNLDLNFFIRISLCEIEGHINRIVIITSCGSVITCADTDGAGGLVFVHNLDACFVN